MTFAPLRAARTYQAILNPHAVGSLENIRGDAVGGFLQIERAGVGDVLGACARHMASDVADGLCRRVAGKRQGQSGVVSMIDPLIVLEPGIGGLLAVFQQE